MKNPILVLACFVLPAFLAFAENPLPTLPPLPPALDELHPVRLLSSGSAEFAFSDFFKGTEPSSFTALPAVGSGLAYRAVIARVGKKSYEVEAKIKTIAAVKKGDVVLARFLARAVEARQESGDGSIDFGFQHSVAPHEKSVGLTLAPGAEWTRFDIPFVIANDFPAGEAVAAFALADLKQTLEISDLEILDFGDRVKIEQLPKTTFSYRGREADAPWREAALKRIEEIRTAPLKVRVMDALGKPISGAQVEVKLVQSEFLFGSSVNDQMIVADSPDATRYRSTITEFFNTVVIENGLKWPAWSAGPQRQAIAIQALEWIQQNGLRHKGHNMVWPGWKFSPRGLKDLPELSSELPKRISAHIKEMVEVTKGRTFAWDVVNEPLHERDFFEIVPEISMADWYKLAHSLNPDLKLIINDYHAQRCPQPRHNSPVS